VSLNFFSIFKKLQYSLFFCRGSRNKYDKCNDNSNNNMMTMIMIMIKAKMKNMHCTKSSETEQMIEINKK